MMFKVLVIAAALAVCGTAGAETLTPPPAPATAPHAIDMSRLRASLAQRYDGANASMPTAVDHRFSRDNAVGSFGYLCGIANFPDASRGDGGPASAVGRGTTFLGAKLSYAFH